MTIGTPTPRESPRSWVRARRIRVACAITGALLTSLTPFFFGGSSVPLFTDVEARIGYAALAVFVHAMIGGTGGWAIGALINWILAPRE